MALAIFDLDNTLIAGDSDVLWGDFLGERGYVDRESFTRAHDIFYQQYLDGSLDIFEFLRFQLGILARHEPDELKSWREDYFREKILPIILPQARELIEKHRQQGDVLLIITATNRFLTEPIAHFLGIDNLLAAEPEMVDGRYTGEVSGIPTFAEGKVQRLQQWLQETGHDLAGSWFYSDSRNDLPLLQQVDNPVAVDADEVLTAAANDRGWPVISLR